MHKTIFLQNIRLNVPNLSNLISNLTLKIRVGDFENRDRSNTISRDEEIDAFPGSFVIKDDNYLPTS